MAKKQDDKEVVVQVVFESSPLIMYRFRCKEEVKAGDFVIVESKRAKHMPLAIAKVDTVLLDDAKATKYVIAVVDDHGHLRREEAKRELAILEQEIVAEAEKAFVHTESIKVLGEAHPLVQRMRALQAELS